jgi:endonuclease/exonuclease/phosphatase family metal-dependent hydrolase
MRTSHLIRAAAIFLTFVTGCVPAARNSSTPLRVLVYNIHAGTDAERVDNLVRVADIVRQSRADIVLLQEVDSATRRSGGVDQLSKVKSLTGFHGVFGRAIDYDGGGYGIAILSRWPIEGSAMNVLPVTIADSVQRARYEARGALVAKVRSPSGVIRIVDTHLDATRTDSNRVQQAVTLRTVANAQRDSGLTLIGGDLNSEPGSAVTRMLDEAGWKDLFQSCGSGQPYSFPANAPVKRIDYLFGSADVRCTSAAVIDTQASDHRPVLFELIVKGTD